eukprot:TRINITY_DN2202_c6_g1_i1.p1 TRINITY_DN2202_c6_g1~~TRINITY_DN2202_c6_g1_i1.p1  ORF type:complete len:306 (+),score=64.12 TRINITY_DN2202_c6_g1_i1:91-918(+)
MDVGTEVGGEDDDEVKKPSYFQRVVYGLQDPTARVRRLGRIQLGLSFFQMSLCVIVFVFGFVASGQGESQFRTLFSACVGFLSSVFGVHGATRQSEGTTRLFFVFQMWALSTLTMYLYVTVRLESQQNHLCNPAVADYGSSNTQSCLDKMHEQRSKVAMALLGALTSVLSCMVSLDFNDAINDLMAAAVSDPSQESKGKANARAHRRANFSTLPRAMGDPADVDEVNRRVSKIGRSRSAAAAVSTEAVQEQTATGSQLVARKSVVGAAAAAGSPG